MDIVLIKSYSNKPWRSPETYQLIETSLAKRWDVFSIDTNDPGELKQFIKEKMQKTSGELFVFNTAEYLNEIDKTGFIPDILEELKIPHLGSSAQAIALGLDKAKTKVRLIENGIRTPDYFITGEGNGDYSRQAERIGYPLFVKPLNEGGHIGIGKHSIVNNPNELNIEISSICLCYKEPALVEKYIGGTGMREFSVGIICGKKWLFTPVEIDYNAMKLSTDILSFETAEDDLERIIVIKDKDTQERLIKITEETFKAVEAMDYSRVDIRMNASGYYVLEINIMPGLGPHSFLPEAAESIHGMKYEQFIQTLAESSMNRQGLMK